MSIARIEGFMIDLDGTTYLGDRIIPGAAEFYRAATSLGKKVLYLTNNSACGPARYVARLRAMGIPAGGREVFTSGEATISYMKRSNCRSVFPLTTAEFGAMMSERASKSPPECAPAVERRRSAWCWGSTPSSPTRS